MKIFTDGLEKAKVPLLTKILIFCRILTDKQRRLSVMGFCLFTGDRLFIYERGGRVNSPF